jgi:signal peptidase I
MEETPTPQAAEPGSQSKGSGRIVILFWIRDLSLSVLISIVVILFVYQPVQVEGTSMMPALVDQERIFINKFAYRFGFEKIERGDTVVFWFPGDTSKSYIKRVIGLPDDVVRIDRGTVYVNGRRLPEAYVPDEYRDRQSMAAVSVEPGSYFVLGDHRASSNDSRNWGLVDRRFIYGKAVFVYWPPDKMGPVR